MPACCGPEDNLEDLVTVVDFWQRFSRAYHRNGAHEWTLDANDIAQEHDERVLQVFEADAYECDDALRHAAAKFMAAGTQYSFLVALREPHGPRRHRAVPAGRLEAHAHARLHQPRRVRPAVARRRRRGRHAQQPHRRRHHRRRRDRHHRLRARAYTAPEDYQSSIVGFGLYTSDFLTDRYTPVGMDSRAELIDTLNAITQELTRGHAQPLLALRRRCRSTRWSRAASTPTSTRRPRPTTWPACTTTEDWFFVDDRTRRFWPIANEEYGMDAYVDQFAVLLGQQGSSTEYYLHPTAYDVWRRSRRARATCRSPGRNAVLVPAHILSDHDYPLRVNANGLADAKGHGEMEPKSGLYTIAGGKLTQDEMNQRARDFRSKFTDGWRYFDENTIKWHHGEPEIDAMYRYTQEQSRNLRDRGLGAACAATSTPRARRPASGRGRRCPCRARRSGVRHERVADHRGAAASRPTC